MPSINTAAYQRLTETGDDLVSALSPQSHGLNLVTGGWEDFNKSMVDSAAASPISPEDQTPPSTSGGMTGSSPPVQSSEATFAGSSHLIPMVRSSIKCCRCDEEQPFLQEWDPNTGEHRAVCSKCTSAFCRKCEFQDLAMNVFLFKDGKVHLPHFPADNLTLEYFFSWFCNTCGRAENIPQDKVRVRSKTVSANHKDFRCEPCSQKASADCVFVATSTPPTLRKSSIESSSTRPVFSHASSFPQDTQQSRQKPEPTRAFTFDENSRPSSSDKKSGIRSRLSRMSFRPLSRQSMNQPN